MTRRSAGRVDASAFRSPLTVEPIGEPHGDPLSNTTHAVLAFVQVGKPLACVSWFPDAANILR